MQSPLWIIVLYIWNFIPVMLSEVNNNNKQTKAFCHNEKKIIKSDFDCDVENIKVTVKRHHNHVEQCHWNHGKVRCINGNYDETSKSLRFSFTFHLEKHAGKQLEIHTMCKNRSHVKKTYIMIPCRSEFTVSATYNKGYTFLTCQHKFFTLSSEGIHIKRKEEDDFIVTCTWNRGILKPQCQTNEQGYADKNGIHNYKAKYPGQYQCVMGGQIIDIPYTDVPTSTGTTTKKPNSWSETRNASLGTSSGCTRLSPTQLLFLIPLFITFVPTITECGYLILPS
ncbi:uncharacterized protein LOC134242458 isoform X2 [Saccostrea cucullata]|uniref:uncharacterized protein LOC134242458 isoform X2 n=1 Tax=Saccostrea cuccullata TaxID=36930 RepID=UPI002ED5CBA2